MMRTFSTKSPRQNLPAFIVSVAVALLVIALFSVLVHAG